MINRCFTVPFTLRRFAEGPSGPFLDGYAATLLAESYAFDGCRCHLRTAAELGEWCARRSIEIADLDEEILGRFVHWRRGKRMGYDRTPFRAQRFLRYLRESGAVLLRAPTKPRQWPVVVELAAWMRQCGLAEGTIARTVLVAEALIDALGEKPQRWDASGVRRFVLDYVRQHAPSSAGLVTTSTRCFLRYLAARRRCATRLIDAVPKVPTWRMARLPRYLVKEDVERIIASCGGQDHTALRNRALLLLLARLGLRAHEVVGLRLGDIDWHAGRLRVLGKGGREARLPLPQDAGDAILHYLKKERPAAPTDHVFLTSRAPIGPLRTAGLRDVVARAIVRSGVQTPFRGTHVLRHSLATRLLREGAALDTIGAVLRHRSVDTTAIYAKVDVNLLRKVAQPWPAEVSPC
jgi:integrase/recombinase XerD